MNGILEIKDHVLTWKYGGELMQVEGWGENSLRVRATMHTSFTDDPGALCTNKTQAEVKLQGDRAIVRNGAIMAQVLKNGRVTFFNQDGQVLLDEYSRNYVYTEHPLRVDAREFRGLAGGDFRLAMRFESNPNEKIFGMGQYQQPMLNLKGCKLELAQRNTQASVPFAVSSMGYGFLWNNPAVGSVVFGRNYTEWTAHSTKQLDYWITAGTTPAMILEAYTGATGRPPMMPEYAMGLWQSKLRYQTRDELMAVAREYVRRGIPLSVIVIDFLHWPHEGDWKFDETYWPDPAGMIRELEEMGIRTLVSIWPTVEQNSENYDELMAKGYLVRAERGLNWSMDAGENTQFLDVTNPDARKRFWEIVQKNYHNLGIQNFWLDVAEPEYTEYDFDNYRYSTGPALQVSNSFPLHYAQTFYEGMTGAGQSEVINLIRCAWAGSQRYGALTWSGDIQSTFEALRCQVAAGLNMGMAGISWWNTDIGGFQGANIEDPAFHELLIRWAQYATFTPVMRMHGFRKPVKELLGIGKVEKSPSGADNELWSYGEDVYEILLKYVKLREDMKPYIMRLMAESHQKGSPVMRPLFYQFPEDAHCWDIEDQFMFGDAVLVAPILYAGKTDREVYLPRGSQWVDSTGTVHEGGQSLRCDAPLTHIPTFVKQDMIGLDGLQTLTANRG